MYITGCWKNYLISTITLAHRLYVQDKALLLAIQLKSQFLMLILCRAFIDLKYEWYLTSTVAWIAILQVHFHNWKFVQILNIFYIQGNDMTKLQEKNRQ